MHTHLVQVSGHFRLPLLGAHDGVHLCETLLGQDPLLAALPVAAASAHGFNGRFARSHIEQSIEAAVRANRLSRPYTHAPFADTMRKVTLQHPNARMQSVKCVLVV